MVVTTVMLGSVRRPGVSHTATIIVFFLAVLIETMLHVDDVDAWRSLVASSWTSHFRHLRPLLPPPSSSTSSSLSRLPPDDHSPSRRRFLTLYVIRGGDIETTKDDAKKEPHTATTTPKATTPLSQAITTAVRPLLCVEYPPVEPLSKKKALVLMDVFCDYHGMFLAERAKRVYGVAVVFVFSNYMRGYFLKQHQRKLQRMQEEAEAEGKKEAPIPRKDEQLEELLLMCMPESPEETKEWYQELVRDEGYELVGIVCDSDSGLADAEQLGDWLPLTNHNGYNEARRNKYKMNDAVKAAGIPAVRQCLCDTVEEAVEFATSLGLLDDDNDEEEEKIDTSIKDVKPSNATSSDLVVVKPVRGCASDDVFLCRDVDSVRSAFVTIQGSTKFGSPSENHTAVLVQEFAVGQEFAIDTVSKDGEMKITALWIYDKRPVNGAPFVYHATKLYDGEHCQVLYEYLRDCLKALDVRWGITHSEIIMTESGPRLVEVNCRQHNMDFIPLTMNGIGYNMYDVLLSAYLGNAGEAGVYGAEAEGNRLNWDKLPLYPKTRMNAAMVHLVNHQDGVLIRPNDEALREVQAMASTWDLEVYPPFLEAGNEISPTIDIKSDAGWVQLVHPDLQIFERDYRRIVDLMPTLFQVEKEEEDVVPK